ncbi:MAG TPA: histidinol dehydrogenase [bacterium]|nr:histidinol dehydrogenase [bacterium]HXK44687.1 histidinol dehydrogenase [bacterium]
MLQIRPVDVEKVLKERKLFSTSVENIVSKIISDVQKRRDGALRYWTKKFDGVDIDNFQISEQEITSSVSKISKSDRQLIKQAIKRITSYHKKQRIKQFVIKEKEIKISFRVKPVNRVGLYIPGGTAPLVSTVLMTGLPAKIAGVKEIIACSPPSCNGSIHPYIIAALDFIGVNKIFKVGGAQAIAAMAYGTETIPKVNVIAGPGNIYVNAAKKILAGIIGIDLLAGPSELVVLIDSSANPDFVIADLNAQEEHKQSMIFLISEDSAIARKISNNVKAGYWIKIDTMESAIDIVNTIAPEHLQIVCKNANAIAEKVIAGAIFIGSYTPCAIGDYIAGPSHTLPTGGSAIFDSGLNVFDFMRSYAVIEAQSQFFKKHGIIIERLAEIENLLNHKMSVEIRRKKLKKTSILEREK